MKIRASIVVFSISLAIMQLALPACLRAARLQFVNKPDEPRTIVFVHGLIGDPVLTFKHPTADKSWPSMMAVDNRILRSGSRLSDYRIGLLSYDTNEGSGLTVEELAARVLTHLTAVGLHDSSEELIFVTHSLGGIIMKRVLTLASQNPRWQKLAERTTLMFLISSPSSGSPAATAAKYLPSLFKKANRQVLDLTDIDDNTYLQSTHNAWELFLQRRPRPHILCAYEKRETYGIKIVPLAYADSACGGLRRAEDTNHIDIVKPRSRDASIYTWVRLQIGASEFQSDTSKIRSIIETLRNGTPDTDNMIRELAFAWQEMLPRTQELLKVMGRTKLVERTGEQQGVPSFRVKFENGSHRWLFRENPGGKVDVMYFEIEKLKDGLRIPGTREDPAEILKATIEQLRSGSPDYGRMSPQLAAAIQAQLPLVQNTLARLGRTNEMRRIANQQGMDTYRVQFAHGSLVWLISVDVDDTIIGLLFR